MDTNPFTQFERWYAEWTALAKQNPSITEPTAMCLATATPQGIPSARIVLLKGFDERGLCFYSNMESRKGQELASNPSVALCFYWMPLERQVRVEGRVEPVSPAEADAYFASRRRESRIGAWASAQSRPVESREALMARVEEHSRRFEGQEVPRPPYWSGWRVVPQAFEFWQQGDFRLHDRFRYEKKENAWQSQRLCP